MFVVKRLFKWLLVLALLQPSTSTLMANNQSKKLVLWRTLNFVKPKPPEHLNVVLWEPLTLVCEAAATNGPVPSIFWQKEGQFLERFDHQNSTGDSTVSSATKSILQFDCLHPENLGLYTCIADNGLGRIATSTTVTALPPPHVHHGHHSKHRCIPDDNHAPGIVTWTRNTVQKEQTTAHLQCRATGKPAPTVSWEFHPLSPEFLDQVVQIRMNSTKRTVLANGDLQIRDLEWTDMGNYACVADNEFGNERAEAFLYVAKNVSEWSDEVFDRPHNHDVFAQ